MEPANGDGHETYLLFLWSPLGYELLERTGAPPVEGAVVEEADRRFQVTRVASSPLPGDRRPCAFLQPV